VAAAFCSRCGEALEHHGQCDRAGRPGTKLDPPRFCADCGMKLTIQVEPAGYTARCRRCERLATPI
jgi:hypothetical protein